MTEVVRNSEYQSLQHFISHYPWAQHPVIDQVAQDCDHLFGGSSDTGLILKESSIPKKGKKSVAAARQWGGRLGKVITVKSAYLASLVKGALAALIDLRLYLPEEWTDDRNRCRAAGVPDDVTFKTKSELALEIVRNARSQEIRFSWVGIDCGCGKESCFLSSPDDGREQLVADVHKDQVICLEDPKLYLPQHKSSKGRAPSQLVTDVPTITVEAWAAKQPEDAWQRITTRDSTK